MTPKDQEIVEGLRASDKEAFNMLFHKYSQPLLRHIYRMTSNKEISEEILNETFMTIIKKINFYQDRTNERGTFKSWIFRIATNESIDHIRKENRRKKKLDSIKEKEVFQQTPEEEIQSIQEEGLIYKLMMELPTVQRTILNLKIKEELSYIEISRVCGCSVNAVKQALFRARVNLKNKLELCEAI